MFKNTNTLYRTRFFTNIEYFRIYCRKLPSYVKKVYSFVSFQITPKNYNNQLFINHFAVCSFICQSRLFFYVQPLHLFMSFSVLLKNESLSYTLRLIFFDCISLIRVPWWLNIAFLLLSNGFFFFLLYVLSFSLSIIVILSLHYVPSLFCLSCILSLNF